MSMTFAIVKSHPSLVTCELSYHDYPRRGNAPHQQTERCYLPEPAEVRIEVGPCEACDGKGRLVLPTTERSGLVYQPAHDHAECLTCHGSGDNEGQAKLRAILKERGVTERWPLDAVLAAIEEMV